MKKMLFSICLFSSMITAYAQTPASLSDAPLPAIPGPVGQPMTANSSTLQQLTLAGGVVNSFSVHSWDVSGIGSSGGTLRGIAWHRTNAAGGVVSDGFLNLPEDVYSIDLAVYQGADLDVFVLAAYYVLLPASAKGYYYEIFRFMPGGGLVPYMPRTLLQNSDYAGINVDVNGESMNMAITWSNPSEGIHVRTFRPGIMGPDVLIPGTSGFNHPDICVSAESSVEWLHFSYRSPALNYIRVMRWRYSDAWTAVPSYTVMYNTPTSSIGYGKGRIDAPDRSLNQRWALVYAESGGGSDKIFAAVRNQTWSSGVTLVPVHNDATTGSGYQNNPVLAYNNNADRIQVGWISRKAIAGGNSYVGKTLRDMGTSVPDTLPASYVFISNLISGPVPTAVLAFSGQNTRSNFHGLHTVYSQLGTIFPSQYCLKYKDRAWGPVTFRLGETQVQEPVVFPNPFTDAVTLTMPAKGQYDISITGSDGKLVFSNSGAYGDQEQVRIPAGSLAPGVYFLNVRCMAQEINYTRQLLRKAND